MVFVDGFVLVNTLLPDQFFDEGTYLFLYFDVVEPLGVTQVLRHRRTVHDMAFVELAFFTWLGATVLAFIPRPWHGGATTFTVFNDTALRRGNASLILVHFFLFAVTFLGSFDGFALIGADSFAAVGFVVTVTYPAFSVTLGFRGLFCFSPIDFPLLHFLHRLLSMVGVDVRNHRCRARTPVLRNLLCDTLPDSGRSV
jgi:hypothetical protein